MEPGTEKPPSSDAPSPNIKTVSPESEHIESPVIYIGSQETSRCNQTRVQAENQPDRSSPDTTSSHSDAPQFWRGWYHQDGGESSQTSSVRPKLTSSSRRLKIPGGTHFDLRRRLCDIPSTSAAPIPYKISGFNFSEATLSQKTDSAVIQGPDSISLSSLYGINIDRLFSPSYGHGFRMVMSDPPLTLPPAESSHTAAQNTTLPPSSTDVSGRDSVVHHSSCAGGKPEEQTTCSEPESPPGSDISAFCRENTLTTSFFGIPTPPPSGLHKYAKSLAESGLVDLGSSPYGRYSGLQHPNSDPEGHVWREIQMFDPLTPEPTVIMYPHLPPASRTESNASSAADPVPSTTLKGLESSSIREALFFPSCLLNRNRTDDGDSSSLMSTWGSQDTECDWSMQFENASGAESDHQMETNLDVAFSLLNGFPTSFPHSSDTRLRKPKRTSGSLTRCISAPSLSEIPPPIGPHSTVTQAKSLPNVHFRSSFEDFTPDITVEVNEETFWFRCSCPGLYRCSVTGLVFHMTGDGVVVYRVVPWNRKLLAQYHKQPAGPLFDIKCEQRSVQQLYLPHCEIYSRGRCRFPSVAHVEDEGIEFIAPRKVTETHIIINIARFSGFGIIKDEDLAPEPVRALVLLFYRPPSSSDNSSLLNVLLLPKNVVLRDVVHRRKKLVGDECYIETTSCCKLQPGEEYTLSTCPKDDTVEVEPSEAEFDCDNYDNFFPSFQVSLETVIKHMKLFLRDSSQRSVWERRVCLSVSAVNQRRCPSARDGPSHERLLGVRGGFIKRVSGPVLKGLLDTLFDKKVITRTEMEEAEGIRNRADTARFVINTVTRKGEAASSEMIKILFEDDPFLCESLGLI